MIQHSEISDKDLRHQIRRKEILLGGNNKLKIYGALSCTSGKRMKRRNRVFFKTEQEALQNNYRPCGHCLPVEYKRWRMDLFDQTIDKHKNWLPYGGTVNYYGKLYSQEEADHYLEKLLNTIEWRNDEAVIFGRKIVTKRKVAWYGEKPFEYTYSNVTKQALPWTKDLLALKVSIENETGEIFNSCLLNLYHNGDEGMAWHSDGETDLKKNGAIGSLSFGAERRFAFKHKQTKETIALTLEHGSLLVMKGATQTHWLHRLPLMKKVHTPRVNLTFRTIIE